METQSNDAATNSGPIFVVDDNPVILMLIEAALTAEGHEVVCLQDTDALFAKIEASAAPPKLLVADRNLESDDGLRVLDLAKRRLPGLKTLLISGSPLDLKKEESAPRPDAFLLKPLEIDSLTQTVDRLLADT